MRRLGRLTLNKGAVLATLICFAAVLTVTGASMFSPGPLNSDHRRGGAPGGVAAHADLVNNCAACHAPPWSGATMGSRCLDCHANVRQQLATRKALHGKMPNGADCRQCHTEHKGAHARITNLAGFNHDWTNFKLTGKHATVACQNCHRGELLQAVASTCVSCHAEPAVHKGRFGSNCSQCHSTDTWSGAIFSHTMFNVNHGRRNNTCVTCHDKPSEFKSYTCYNCHEHTPERIERIHARRNLVNLQDCAKCHNRGKRGRRVADASHADGLHEFCEGPSSFRELAAWLLKSERAPARKEPFPLRW